MQNAVLYSHGSSYDDRNFFLDMTLGLVSASRRLQVLLPPTSSSTDTGAPDHGFDLLVLGLISFARNIERNANSARLEPSVDTGGEDAPHGHVPNLLY